MTNKWRQGIPYLTLDFLFFFNFFNLFSHSSPLPYTLRPPPLKLPPQHPFLSSYYLRSTVCVCVCIMTKSHSTCKIKYSRAVSPFLITLSCSPLSVPFSHHPYPIQYQNNTALISFHTHIFFMLEKGCGICPFKSGLCGLGCSIAYCFFANGKISFLFYSSVKYHHEYFTVFFFNDSSIYRYLD